MVKVVYSLVRALRALPPVERFCWWRERRRSADDFDRRHGFGRYRPRPGDQPPRRRGPRVL